MIRLLGKYSRPRWLANNPHCDTIL